MVVGYNYNLYKAIIYSLVINNNFFLFIVQGILFPISFSAI